MAISEEMASRDRPRPLPGSARQRSAAQASSVRPGWRSRLSQLDIKAMPYVLISPFFILFAVFGVFPLLYNLVVSLRVWKLDDPTLDGWAGVANFGRVLSDGDFANALVNTLGIFVVATIPQLICALILAGLLNRPLRARTVLRMGILVPYVTSIAASTLVFGTVFARDTGLANYLLGLVGVTPIDWQSGRLSSWLAIAAMVDWRWIGYNALIYLAAMQSVPRDLYEAASIDGASPVRQFISVTVPMIRPAVIFTVVLSTIGGLQLFTEPLLFDSNPNSASGGSVHQFQTVAMLIYKVGWKDLDLGYAAAMSWVLFLIIIVIASVNGLLTARAGRSR
jgi:cellobiose transport system permease protein